MRRFTVNILIQLKQKYLRTRAYLSASHLDLHVLKQLKLLHAFEPERDLKLGVGASGRAEGLDPF